MIISCQFTRPWCETYLMDEFEFTHGYMMGTLNWRSAFKCDSQSTKLFSDVILIWPVTHVVILQGIVKECSGLIFGYKNSLEQFWHTSVKTIKYKIMTITTRMVMHKSM